MASKIENTPGRLKRQLREAADPAARKSIDRYFKGPVRAIGVRTPTVRRIAAEAAKEYRAARMGVDAVFDIADALWTPGALEERVLAVFLVARSERHLSHGHWSRLQAWAASTSNWVEADGLGIYLIGPLLAREPDLIRQLESWLDSENPSQRRTAIVSLVPLARRGEQGESILFLCDALRDDAEDLVQKAVGWVLRELSRERPRDVADYLIERRPHLSRLVIRHGSEKLPAELRHMVRGGR